MNSTPLGFQSSFRGSLVRALPFRKLLVTAAAATVVLLPASAARAQGYPFSQRSRLVQNIALTQFSIEYGRPVARGRKLFGALVPWDTIWHPGADDATELSFNHDVLMNGTPVKAGTYTLWMVPRESAPWSFVLSRGLKVSHKDYPGQQMDALRLEIAPETQSHIESMSFFFPMVLRDEGVLRFQWGTTSLSVAIKAPYKES